MIKDRILSLDNGVSYYIIEELEKDNRKFILALPCDIEQDKATDEDFAIKEISMEGEDLVITSIEDEIATEISLLLLEKVRNN